MAMFVDEMAQALQLVFQAVEPLHCSSVKGLHCTGVDTVHCTGVGFMHWSLHWYVAPGLPAFEGTPEGGLCHPQRLGDLPAGVPLCLELVVVLPIGVAGFHGWPPRRGSQRLLLPLNLSDAGKCQMRMPAAVMANKYDPERTPMDRDGGYYCTMKAHDALCS
jgi:hypothetical protein